MNSKTAKEIRKLLGIGEQPNPMMEISMRKVYRRIKKLWRTLTFEYKQAALAELRAQSAAMAKKREES